MSPPWAGLLKATFTADVAIAAVTETIVLTLSGLNARSPDQRVNLRGWVQVTGVAATTSLAVQVRRGTAVTGTLVGESNAITPVGAQTVNLDVDVQDSPGEVASQSYVLTVTPAGAGGTATALQGALEAELV